MNAMVKDVMTTHVVAVRKCAPFKDMAARLREHRVSAFPVLDDDDRVIGVVSEADLLTKEALEFGGTGKVSSILHHREQVKAAGITAEDLMTAPPVTIGPNEFVSHAARLMYSRRVKRLPVVDDNGRLIGIVSRSDVLSVYSRPDADIRHDIIERIILDTLLTDPARFTVTVHDGIVTVEGMPETASVGHDMIDEIRHVEGVVAVHDRLSYPPAQRPVPAPGPGPLFCPAMYLASAPTEVSGLTMLVVAIVVSLSLAAWLGLVFLADRQPRRTREQKGAAAPGLPREPKGAPLSGLRLEEERAAKSKVA